MKATAVQRILTSLYEAKPTPKTIHVITSRNAYPIHPRQDEEHTTFEVVQIDNVLELGQGDDTTTWIDCDDIVAIEL